MFGWLTNLLVPKGYFRLAGGGRNLPACDIRLLRDADFEVCEDIYRLNEAAHFPEGYFGRFSKWLRNRNSLILVAEVDGAVLGLGGINFQEQAGQHFVALSFGMVHPAHQRQGLGSTLLLSRLALIDAQTGPITAMLTTVGGSEAFCGRFGFSFSRASPPRMALSRSTTSSSSGRIPSNAA